MTIAWTKVPSVNAPSPPSATAHASSTGRSTVPTAATRMTSQAMAATPVVWTPGTSQSVAASTRNEVSPSRVSERIRATVGRRSRSVST